METVFDRKFVKIDRNGTVYFLTMRNKLNILSYEMMSQLNDAYDFMEHKTEGEACLVTVSAIPKVFSAGLDLKFLLKIINNRDEKIKYLSTYQALLSKLLKLPMMTIAIINGHNVAAGLALSLCHDYRIMNKDFGTLSMNQIKNGLPLPPGVNGVCKHRITHEYYKYLLLTGEPIGPEQAKKAKIVDELYPLENLQERGYEMGKKLAASAKHRKAMKEIKYEMNKQMIHQLDEVGVESTGKGITLIPKI